MRRRELLLGLAVLPSAALAGPPRKHPVVRFGKSKLTVEIGADPPVSRETILAWVKRAGTMVVDYFGRFPVPTLKVEIVTGGGGGLGWGQHFRGRRLEIHAGARTTSKAIRRDWVMVHEMMHCAYPWLERKHRWMREGLSTYLETVVRAEAGVISEHDVWTRWVERMPEGVPEPEDQGFDRTRSWGALYWGGALYWLLADVRIRERTQGKKTLRDALRATLALGNSRVERPIKQVLATGDGATGTGVLSELYSELGLRHAEVDLAALWKRLGVTVSAAGVGFDERAPLAALRREMSKPRHRLPPLPS